MSTILPAVGVSRGPGLRPVRRRLPGGAAVLVCENTATPAASISLSVPAGAICDPAGLPGVANMVARLLDRGTLRRASDVIAEELDSRGISIAVTASFHHLTATATCLSEDAPAVLALLVEMFREPAFPADELEKRRAEVVTQIRQDEDNPAARCVDEAFALLFPDGHPYGRPVRGTVESVSRVTRDDLLAFHRRYVGQEGAIVIVVGDVDVESTHAEVAELLRDWTSVVEPAPALPPAELPDSRIERFVTLRDKAQADIAVALPGPSRTDPDHLACVVMNTILGQFGVGGRLGDSIRERQGMAYYAYSAFDPALGPGAIVVRAGVDPANVARTIASIDAELATLAAGGATAAELRDTVCYLVGSIPRALETNAGIAAFLHDVEVYGLGLDYDVRLPDLLAAVTLDDVGRLAASLLDPGRAVVVTAGPGEADPSSPPRE